MNSGEEAPSPSPPPADRGRGKSEERVPGPLSPKTGGGDGAGSRTSLRPALLAILAYFAFSLLVPLVPVQPDKMPLPAILGLVAGTTFAFMLLQLTLSRAVVRTNPTPALCVAAIAAFVAVWFVVYAFMHTHGVFFVFLLRDALRNLTIALACTFAGALLSRIVKEVNVLLPVALVAMPVDYLGAMTPQGFTHTVVKTAPKVVDAVSVHVPQMGGIAPLGLIGPGDVLFMAFFFAIVHRLKLNERGTFAWMVGLLTATMLYVLTPHSVNVAALVPMGLAVILANARYFRLRRAEVFASLYAGVIVLALIAGLYVYLHRQLTGH